MVLVIEPLSEWGLHEAVFIKGLEHRLEGEGNLWLLVDMTQHCEDVNSSATLQENNNQLSELENIP